MGAGLDNALWRKIKAGDMLVGEFDERGFLVLGVGRENGQIVGIEVLNIAAQEKLFWTEYTSVGEYWDLTLKPLNVK